MIKLYTLFLTLIISISGFTQVNIRPVKQADSRFLFIDNNGKAVKGFTIDHMDDSLVC